MSTIPHATLEEAARLHDHGMHWREIGAALYWDWSGLRAAVKRRGLLHSRPEEAARMRTTLPTPRWATVAATWGYEDGQAACHAAYVWRKRHPHAA